MIQVWRWHSCSCAQLPKELYFRCKLYSICGNSSSGCMPERLGCKLHTCIYMLYVGFGLLQSRQGTPDCHPPHKTPGSRRAFEADDVHVVQSILIMRSIQPVHACTTWGRPFIRSPPPHTHTPPLPYLPAFALPALPCVQLLDVWAGVVSLTLVQTQL
jgi:hypothetical protein